MAVQFAELVHELLCGLPTSSMDEAADEEAGESMTVACLLRGEAQGCEHLPSAWPA